MKFNLKESVKILFVIIIFILVGFFRDALFMHLNSQLYKLYFKNYEYTLPDWLALFDSWSYMKLYYFKYFLSGFFILFYLFLSVQFVKVFTKNPKNTKWVYYAYGIVLLLSLITYSGGYLLHNFPKGFVFTRNLIGLLQSPFITMIIIPALKLEKGSTT